MKERVEKRESRQFIVTSDEGITNRYDTLEEAAKAAKIGDSIWIPEGFYTIRTNTIPSQR
jgi:hypothetical protein